MKHFNVPAMNVVTLNEEDIMTSSTDCPRNVCYGHDCPECVTCTGGFECAIFDCKGKYTNE